MISPAVLWAKLRRDDAGRVIAWHSLVDHSADVAAVIETLLAQPILRGRLATAAGMRDLDRVTRARLAALAFLHDIGKANRGFRARVDIQVDRRPDRVGHIHQLAWVFGDDQEAKAICKRLGEVLAFERLEPWFTDGSWPLFASLFAHHGRPWDIDRPPPSLNQWCARGDSDPVADLAPMRIGLERWFGEAFKDGPPLPEAPAFHHAFAGLLQLADWLGSDERFFPFANGACRDRMAEARPAAVRAIGKVGLDAAPSRAAIRMRAPVRLRRQGRPALHGWHRPASWRGGRRRARRQRRRQPAQGRGWRRHYLRRPLERRRADRRRLPRGRRRQ
jgi:CRISPR-associated endonuclease/helicase Cas3